ncbi:ThiF family adenylyltransferase [Acidovorax sp. LjRoot129]|uniref:HesA/MoeB/ThiF family protein n=1 Tax=Acidovorax sp. LjRoot129 TaxID=3342260 RepID=UPI003ECDD142
MTTASFDYPTFVARNEGYVARSIQHKISEVRLLIAGCGLGASTAIAAARMGFRHFVLVDGDTVELHNLNRQFYDFADVGSLKVDALARQLRRINPDIAVTAVAANLDAGNVQSLVGQADVVFDTIDFLDLEAILHLHGTARAMGRPVFTALSIGFGAGVLYFPGHSGPTLPQIVAPDVARVAAQGEAGYGAVFAQVMSRIGSHLDAQVMEQVARALTVMEDGRPCPASQISVGSFAVAALAISMIHDMLEGRAVPVAPNLVVHSFRNHVTRIVDISGG